MTWETSLTYILLAAAVIITVSSTSFLCLWLAWRMFWSWIRDEILCGWAMLDKPEKDDDYCPCDCKCKGHDPRTRLLAECYDYIKTLAECDKMGTVTDMLANVSYVYLSRQERLTLACRILKTIFQGCPSGATSWPSNNGSKKP